MHLITGYTGTAHITAANDGAINAHVFGKASYVFNSRDKFEATIENNNTINIGSGEGLFNGRYFEIASGSADVANIDNGTSGTKRIDLIVARYERDNDTNIESMNVVVIKGTPGTNPVTPAHNTGNILDGVGIADYPLYKVEINGLSITNVTKLFTIREDIVADVKADNAETLAEITADNAQTLAEIKADNAAHFNGIIDGTVPANTATKLGTATVGGSETPIYLENGTPKTCTVDTKPTSGSNNLIESNAVATTSKHYVTPSNVSFAANSLTDNVLKLCKATNNLTGVIGVGVGEGDKKLSLNGYQVVKKSYADGDYWAMYITVYNATSSAISAKLWCDYMISGTFIS